MLIILNEIARPVGVDSFSPFYASSRIGQNYDPFSENGEVTKQEVMFLALQFAGFSRLPPASPEARYVYDLCGFSKPASPRSSFQQRLGCKPEV